MQHGLSLTGDLFWIVALAVMAGCSRWAWSKVKPDARVPIHWNAAGEPALRIGKTLGLAGLPAIAFLIGGYMKVESLSPALGFNTLLIVFLVRLSAAPLFAMIHLIQVRRALLTLANEGEVEL